MMLPLITAQWAAIFIVILIFLSVTVILRRRAIRVTLGDGKDEILQRRIRAHGNFAEFVPFGLFTLLLLELLGVSAWQLWSFGCLFALGRLLHIAAIWRASLSLRVAGMGLTLSMLGIGALMLLWRSFA